MVDAGGLRSVRKCHWVALADLGDTGGFGREGKENRLYAFQLSEGVYKRKEVTLEGVRSQKIGELSDKDTSHAVPKRIHTLAFTGSKWVAFADPLQQTGRLIDIKIISPHVDWKRAQSPEGGEYWHPAVLLYPRGQKHCY